jgi:hypothetical protein
MADLYIDPFIVDNVDLQALSNLKFRDSHSSRVVFDSVTHAPCLPLQHVVINPVAHMSPKDRMVHIAQQTQLKPGSPSLELIFNRSRYALVYAAIKLDYLARGHNQADWFKVSSSVVLFNRVWNQFLSLPPSDVPPPIQWRFVLPSQSSIQSLNY